MAETLIILSAVAFFAKKFGPELAAKKLAETTLSIPEEMPEETMFGNYTFAGGEEDPTSWITEGSMASFVLMHAQEVKYLCMLAYTFYHGCKLFKTLPEESSLPYKFVRMIFQCTGGGLLVPIFINAIPVSLSNDAYPICIMISTLVHIFMPILREIVASTPLVKAAMIVLYETQRASVVVKLTKAAAAAIPATEFAFPLFGPIFCGAIAGCGGAFLPMDKGLKPLEGGLADNMFSALIAATSFHLFMNTSMSEGVQDAATKAQVIVAYFFILYSLFKEVGEFASLFKVSKVNISQAVPSSAEPDKASGSKKSKNA